MDCSGHGTGTGWGGREYVGFTNAGGGELFLRAWGLIDRHIISSVPRYIVTYTSIYISVVFLIHAFCSRYGSKYV